MWLYSGYIECGGSDADYEFESDEVLDPMQQLQWLLVTGTLQIMDNPPVITDDDEEEN